MNNLKMALQLQEEKELEKAIKQKILSSKREIDFWNALPDRGFIRDYFDYASPQTSSPDQFHLLCGITILGALLGTRIYFRFGFRKQYPIMWTLLLAPSSLYRKSSAIALAEWVVSQILQDIIYPDEWTKEALLKNMEKQPQGILFPSEFTAFLQYLGKDYMQGTKSWLTGLFDGKFRPFERNTIQQNIKVENPTISILGASSLSWFDDQIKATDVFGGFFPRFLYCPAYRMIKKVKPIPQSDEPFYLEKLISFWNKISKMNGEIKFEKVYPLYELWFTNHEDEIKYHPKEAVLSAFFTRLENYFLKFMLIFQVSLIDDPNKFNGKIEVDYPAFLYAFELTEFLKKELLYIFEYEINTDEGWYPKQRQKYLRTIRNFIEKTQDRKMTRRDLQQRVKDKPEYIDNMIRDLSREGVIYYDHENTEIALNETL